MLLPHRLMMVSSNPQCLLGHRLICMGLVLQIRFMCCCVMASVLDVKAAKRAYLYIYIHIVPLRQRILFQPNVLFIHQMTKKFVKRTSFFSYFQIQGAGVFAGRQVWLIGMSLAVLSESAVSPSSAISKVRGLLLF